MLQHISQKYPEIGTLNYGYKGMKRWRQVVAKKTLPLFFPLKLKNLEIRLKTKKMSPLPECLKRNYRSLDVLFNPEKVIMRNLMSVGAT
jgi:hypothetical protein